MFLAFRRCNHADSGSPTEQPVRAAGAGLAGRRPGQCASEGDVDPTPGAQRAGRGVSPDRPLGRGRKGAALDLQPGRHERQEKAEVSSAGHRVSHFRDLQCEPVRGEPGRGGVSVLLVGCSLVRGAIAPLPRSAGAGAGRAFFTHTPPLSSLHTRTPMSLFSTPPLPPQYSCSSSSRTLHG